MENINFPIFEFLQNTLNQCFQIRHEMNIKNWHENDPVSPNVSGSVESEHRYQARLFWKVAAEVSC